MLCHTYVKGADENSFIKYYAMNGQNRADVSIVLKADQRTGKRTEGIVARLLTNSSTHPHGIKVMPRYFADSQGEVDFVLQYGATVIPVEVKGGEVKSAPSFKAYIKNRQPEIALRFSKMSYRQDGAICNIPLYLAAKTAELL